MGEDWLADLQAAAIALKVGHIIIAELIKECTEVCVEKQGLSREQCRDKCYNEIYGDEEDGEEG